MKELVEKMIKEYEEELEPIKRYNDDWIVIGLHAKINVLKELLRRYEKEMG